LAYHTIHNEVTGEYKEKGSRFLAYVKHIENEQEAEEYITQLRKLHHKARHVCYAYKTGFQNPVIRINDDGEPVHTAGQPILNHLSKYQLTQVVAAVVRYFGGILLGKGGLIRAYGQAVENALVNAKIIECKHFVFFTFQTGFEKYAILQEKLRQFGAEFTSTDFSDTCSFTIRAAEENAGKIKAFLSENKINIIEKQP